MALLLTSVNGQSVTFWSSAALASMLQTALTAIVLRLTSTALSRSSAYGLALAASVFDVLVLAVLLGEILYLSKGRGHGDNSTSKVRLILGSAAVTLSIVALALSMYVLAWSWTKAHKLSPAGSRQSSYNLDLAGFVVWSLGLLSQTVFYTLWLLPRRKIQDDDSRHDSVQDRPSPARSRKRSLSVHLASLAPVQPPPFFRSVSAPVSPAMSTYSSPRSSLRHSVHQVIRPVTSKTRLLLAQSYATRDSRSVRTGRGTSLETVRQDDGFESWDTSDVEEQYESSFVHKSNTRRKLETIPGSRPVSPARALEGPFPAYMSPEDTPLPESPVQSPMSDTDSISSFSRPTSRRPSNNDQSHIHPLFRTHSPVPPPMASPGTIVTASPYAGQVMSPDHALAPRRLHSAAGSRPASPSPLSPVRSRQSSFKSLHRPPTASTEHIDREDVPQMPCVGSTAG